MLRIFRHYFPIPTLVLAIAEFGIFSGALFLVTRLTEHFDPSTEPRLIKFSLAFTLVVLVVMIAIGLYNSDVFLDHRVGIARALVGLLLIAPLAIAAVALLHAMSDLPQRPRRIWSIEAALTWLGCLAITRITFVRVSSLNLFKRRVVVLGTGMRALRLAALARGRGPGRSIPVAFVNASGDPLLVEPTILPLDDNRDHALLARKVRELGAGEIVVATDDRRGLPTDQLLECRLSGIRVLDYVEFCERETAAVDLDALQPSWFTVGDGLRIRAVSEFMKRSFDVIVSLILLLVVLPVILVTTVAIKLESRGPIIYRQVRVGLRGREFTLLKFRSMHLDAEGAGSTKSAQQSDPRVTHVGAFIRMAHIDDLPQLFNVLRGEMSLVGPHPERPVLVGRLANELPFYNARHTVRPGITGWAQVNYPDGGSIEDARQKLAYDLYYLKNRSMFLDLVILVQTLQVILWPVGVR